MHKWIIKFLYGGGDDMMAMLWAQQIMLGKKTYAQAPRLLKAQVKEILEFNKSERHIRGGLATRRKYKGS